MNITLGIVALGAFVLPAAPALAATPAAAAPAGGTVAQAAAAPAVTPTTPTGPAPAGLAPAGPAPVALAPLAPTATATTTPPAGTPGGAPRPAAAPGVVPPTTVAVPPAALVARYTFDAGAPDGRVADTSGRGGPLTVRSADQGAIRFEGTATAGRYAAFPAACARGATACPRGLMEAPNDADLNPGTRVFRWSARVNLTRAQLTGSPNVLQKGVAGTGSLWKMQIGATNGRAQCAVAGTGAATVHIARSSASVADGRWHKVVCQRSGTSLAVYVDGALAGSATIPAAVNISNSLPLRVGGPNFNTRSDMYHGALDDVYAELG